MALDATAFGSRRSFLIGDFLSRAGTRSILDGHSFAIARSGRRATQIGPLVAQNEAAALAALDGLLPQMDTNVVLDVPARWPALARDLERRGFRRQRPFTRMALRHAQPFGDPSRLFASAGPEFG